jgi:2'-5' RNA ligase
LAAEEHGSVERETWRLFIALSPPEQWLAAIHEWQIAELGDDERLGLVARANLHVTLVFLGDTPRHDVPAVEEALSLTLATARRPTFAVRGTRATRSVVMLLLEERGSHAAPIQHELSTQLASRQLLRPEKRRWRPHVTVARHRAGRGLVLDLAPPVVEPWSPSEAAVIHSRLHKTGAHYDIVQSLPIGGSCE